MVCRMSVAIQEVEMTAFSAAVDNQNIDMQSLHDDVEFEYRIDNSTVNIEVES
jgi:hypothetical protein